MSDRIITAFSASAVLDAGTENELPKSIVYLPEGEHTITPKVNGKPQKITINMPAERGDEIAALLQAKHEEREKGTVRPWLDFEHKEGKASALTKGFRYEQGKGIMLELEWTGAGEEAVSAKDYSYFSPTFLVDADNVPSGLPARGPLGALVNEPAFRKMEKIAASDAANSQTNNTHTMSKLILAALSIAEGDEAEAEAVKAIEAKDAQLAENTKTIEAKDAEIKSLTDKVEAHNKERATSLVEAAIADGRIAPNDEETKADFIGKIEAGDEFAEKMLSKLPKPEKDLTKPLVKAGESAKANLGQRRVDAQDNARKELGQDADFSTVWARAQELDPEAFTQ